MGQKIHPIGFRIGVIRDADSKWYADKQYAAYVLEDFKIRKTIKKRKGWDNAAISKIEIERQANTIRVTLHTAKPGIIIGRGGAGVDMLKADLEKLSKKQVHVNVQEIRHLETNAQLVAESIAQQIEKRIGYKRAMRQAVTRAMKLGVRGIRCQVSGRLGGSEMARREQDRQGKIPLHTLRADIDYGFDEALTQYGHIGVKVWIYKGDILPGARRPVENPQPQRQERDRDRDRRDRRDRDRDGGRDGRGGGGGDRGGRGGGYGGGRGPGGGGGGYGGGGGRGPGGGGGGGGFNADRAGGRGFDRPGGERPYNRNAPVPGGGEGSGSTGSNPGNVSGGGGGNSGGGSGAPTE